MTAQLTKVQRMDIQRNTVDSSKDNLINNMYQKGLGKDDKEPHNDDKSAPLPLYIIWCIRDATELAFYIEYIAQVLKAQEGRAPSVYITIYLTGLGLGSDPAQLLSQCLFMLSLEDGTTDYLNINFGRPNFQKIVGSLNPDNCYYCGGKAVKDLLADACASRRCSTTKRSRC